MEANLNQNNSALTFNLGTFEGFNFRSHSGIARPLTAREVVAWDHDRQGEAEFWPSGDRPEVALIFKHRSCVTAEVLQALDRVLTEIGDDSSRSLLLIHYAVNFHGSDLPGLSGAQVLDEAPFVFVGGSFIDLRREAAYELFELYYPEEYRVWEKSVCDGLHFDVNRFLDSPVFAVEEIKLPGEAVLLISCQ